MATTEAETVVPEEEFERAKEMLHGLFALMGIQKVVVVDDGLSTPIEFEDIVGAIQAKLAQTDEAEGPLNLNIPEFEGIDFETAAEVWKDKLREKWLAIGIDRSDAIGRNLDLEEKLESNESERHVLGRILGDVKPEFLSLTEWKAKRDQLIQDANQGATLLLFDQDMRDNPGGRANEGMLIISDLLKNHCEQGPVYFGLFSNTVGANDEHLHHKAFMDEFGLQNMGDRFVVISKSGFDSQPRSLACRLKRVAISPRCSVLKTGIFSAIDKAAAQAKKDVEGLHIYDFEHLVFRSSYNEGVWEVDTLLRLFSVFFRESARVEAASDHTIRKAAEEVRKVVSYPYRPDDAPKLRVNEVARLEMYEKAEYLREHRIPIELGNIFKKKEGKQLYMLLEQPCDLMVRGGDDNKGERNVKFVTLAQIKYIKNKDKPPKAAMKLEYYSEEEGKEAYVGLEKCITVPICILDLCVCSDDGTASIEVGKPCPEGLIPAWKERYRILQSAAGELVEKYRLLISKRGKEIEGLTNGIKLILQSNLLQAVTGVADGKIDLATKKISYGIERVGSLRQPWAAGFLREYAYHRARDAFDHDLTRTEEKRKKDDAAAE